MREGGDNGGTRASVFQRISNRALHMIARKAPGSQSLRPWLHRMRGVKILGRIFIGEDVYLDNEHPDAIEIHEQVQISVRAIVLAHTRGAGKVIIEKAAFIGPNAVIACSAGRVLRIGEGAVIGPGCVITRSVAPRTYLMPPRAEAVARVGLPLPLAKNIQEFIAALQPCGADRSAQRNSAGGNQ
jgi:bifunctional N-acetylglucosamine-1-phosphate-uridyltransferase/glucosamine-1-phosphate-acetyltransferase GlmU-like protein